MISVHFSSSLIDVYTLCQSLSSTMISVLSFLLSYTSTSTMILSLSPWVWLSCIPYLPITFILDDICPLLLKFDCCVGIPYLPIASILKAIRPLHLELSLSLIVVIPYLPITFIHYGIHPLLIMPAPSSLIISVLFSLCLMIVVYKLANHLFLLVISFHSSSNWIVKSSLVIHLHPWCYLSSPLRIWLLLCISCQSSVLSSA